MRYKNLLSALYIWTAMLLFLMLYLSNSGALGLRIALRLQTDVK